MLPELTPSANAYASGARFLDNLIHDFSDQDWAVRDACGHDPRWIVGHLATYRNRVAGFMGFQSDPASWEAFFAKGTSPASLPADLDISAVITSFHTAHDIITNHWDDLTQEILSKPVGRTLPNGMDNVGGAIQFLAWHEAYHLGQLAFLRRLAGKPGLA